MSSKQSHKTTHHGFPSGKGVPILDLADEEPIQETVLIGGAPVSVPHSCGCDGTEHRFGVACVSPSGKVVLFPE